MIPKLTIQSGYSILLFLLIISLIGGDYFLDFQLFGIEFYAFRIVLFGGFIFFLTTKSIDFHRGKLSKWILFTLGFWLLYGAFQLIWSPNLLNGIKEFYYLGIGFVTYVLFLNLKARLTNFYDYLERYWLIGFIVVSIFLIIEFVTHYHIEGSHYDKLLGLGFYHSANAVPVFTFGNPNHLAIYLSFTITLSVYFILKGYNLMIHGLVILLSMNFLLLVESRLSYLFLIVIFATLIVLYAFKFARNSMNLNFKWKGVIILVVLGVCNFTLLYLKYSNSKLWSTENNLIIATETVDSYSAKPGATDYVFPVLSSAEKKLFAGDTVQLQIESLTPKHFNFNELFISGETNEWLSYFLIFCVLLAIGSIIFYTIKVNSNKLLIVILTCGLFVIGIFSKHLFDRPNKKMQYGVLTEVGSKQSGLDELQATSIEPVTAIALIEGQRLSVCFKPSEEEGLAQVDSVSNEQPLLGDDIRKNLILNGIDYLRESNYLGIGPGAFISYNQQKRNKYPIGTIESPHNFLIEILSQYGVIVTGLLLIIILAACVVLAFSFFKKAWTNEHTFAMILLVCLFLLGNANSRFLSLPINWVVFSFIFIVSDELFAIHKKVKGD